MCIFGIIQYTYVHDYMFVGRLHGVGRVTTISQTINEFGLNSNYVFFFGKFILVNAHAHGGGSCERSKAKFHSNEASSQRC